MDDEAQFLVPVRQKVRKQAPALERIWGLNKAYHLGVCPPRMSVVVFFASFPSLAAQYGSCLPIVFRLGRFLARSTMMTRVPISGPSMVISEKIPAVCMAFRGCDFNLAEAAISSNFTTSAVVGDLPYYPGYCLLWGRRQSPG